MDSLIVLCLAIVALSMVDAHGRRSNNNCQFDCAFGTYPNSCRCRPSGLGGIGNRFPGNGGGIGCDLMRCDSYETCILQFGQPRCVRQSMFPGGQLPGGQFPGGQLPGGPFPGGQLPGGQFPGGQLPGGQFPGRQFPGGQPIFPGGQGVCYLPKVTGRCRAYFRRFYFNHRTQRCERFVYGGCGTNGNNFKTYQKCRRACMGGSVGKQY